MDPGPFVENTGLTAARKGRHKPNVSRNKDLRGQPYDMSECYVNSPPTASPK